MDEKPNDQPPPEWPDEPAERLLLWLIGPFVGCVSGVIFGFALGLVVIFPATFFVDPGVSRSMILFYVTGLCALAGTVIVAIAGALINAIIWVVRLVAPRREKQVA